MWGGFGNVTGSIGVGNSTSFGLNYAANSFGANAAYTNVKYYTAGSPQVSVRNWGLGAHYRFGAWYINALVTGASYMYMKGNSIVDNNHANQLAAIVDYSLSKRTSVYVMGLCQRARSGGFAQINGMNSPDGASSGQTQAIARIGLHTHF